MFQKGLFLLFFLFCFVSKTSFAQEYLCNSAKSVDWENKQEFTKPIFKTLRFNTESNIVTIDNITWENYKIVPDDNNFKNDLVAIRYSEGPNVKIQVLKIRRWMSEMPFIFLSSIHSLTIGKCILIK